MSRLTILEFQGADQVDGGVSRADRVSHAIPWQKTNGSINVQSNMLDLSVRGILVERARWKLTTLECLGMARQIMSISDLLSSASLRYSPAVVPFDLEVELGLPTARLADGQVRTMVRSG